MKRILLLLAIVMASLSTYSQSSTSRIAGTYVSSDVSMQNMPGGKGYLVLTISSNNTYTLTYYCSLNGAKMEIHTGEVAYLDDGTQGAGTLKENGQRIATFTTDDVSEYGEYKVVGITLGTIYLKKKR